MTNFQLYGFCLIVSASLVALLSMSTDFFVTWVNDIVIPCQHDSVWTGVGCNCGNSRGVYGGIYCDECQCEHQGICGVLANGNSRWGCRCPSHTKWTGTLCDNCYTENKNASLNRCSGPCINTRGYQHSGPKCDTVCIASESSADDVCREISSGGGVCNACNGHGACTATGQCDCDDGWFNTINGEQCALSCPDVGIKCNNETGICQSVGGELQCVCAPGYYGKNCDRTCKSVNEFPCSGHGNCELTALGAPVCSCETHYVGNMCEHECPGDKTFPTSCSGHGDCVEQDGEAVCACDTSTSWTGVDCSCNAKFTCSGHGACASDATCDCNDWKSPTHQHWSGIGCQKCQEHWYGRECHLHCDPDGEYIPDEFSVNRTDVRDGLDIGCNGFGTCELLKTSVGERVKCSCRGTDPSWFCSKCESSYYPLTSVDSATAYCTTECNRGTCSYRGICNDDYDGNNSLCICDKRTVGIVEFDTIDPKQYCAVCKENWYPGQMDSSNACTHYCAAEGNIDAKIIVFGDNRDLQGDTNAQKICAKEGDAYSPDPDCRVCSGHGTCRGDGECECADSRTGVYCEIDCGQTANGQVCSGHGRCVRNDLDMWFDPFTTDYRCECQPYDTYTAETRQRLIKNGVSLDPPVSPNYYGKYCEFHCPRYNEAICAGRGDCKTGITVPVQDGPGDIEAGKPLDCSEDTDCASIPGAFCAQLSSPWDSLMSGKSFFSSGPSSPGYFTCASSQNCLDSIYSIAWDDYCVSMLSGWYPVQLNTAMCTYHSNEQTNCRTKVEDYFVSEYMNSDKTWCQAAMEELSPIDCATKDCVDSTDECCVAKKKCEKPADAGLFGLHEKLCHTWELEAACSSTSSCIYDKTFQYVQETDIYCASLIVENDKCLVSLGVQSVYADQCKPTFDGSVCEAKTYCRAKTCEDAIFDVPVESLCINVEPACKGDQEWARECTHLTGQLRNLSDLNVKDTFFSCVMYDRSMNPQKVSLQVPGAATIFGELSLKYGDNSATADIPIQTFRQNFLENRILLDERTTCGQQLSNISFGVNNWCEDHLNHVIPSWTTSLPQGPNWFQEYLVYCSSGIESLWTQSSDADKRVQELKKDCTVQFKCKNRLNPNWKTGCPESDSNSVYEKQWSLHCLSRPTIEFDEIDWSTFPTDISACKLQENVAISRWGNSKWSIHDIEEKFTNNCENGLEAPWIPKEAPIPTVCSLGACANGHECVPCSNSSMGCNSGVVCIAKGNINCFEDNPCQNGGQCYQPFYFESSNKYLCEWEHVFPVIVTMNDVKYDGVLSSRDQLTIYSASATVERQVLVEKNGFYKSATVTTIFRRDGNIIVPNFGKNEWSVKDVCVDNSGRNNVQCLLNASTWVCGNQTESECQCSDNSGRTQTQCLLNASSLTVPARALTDVLPLEIESCSDDDNFNWYEFCAQQELGSYLETGAKNGLKPGWFQPGTKNILLEDRKLLLTETEHEFVNYTVKIIIDTKHSEPGAGLSLTVGQKESFWYVNDEVLPYTDYAATPRLNTLEILGLTKKTGKIKLKAMFGKKIILASIQINGVEQLLSLKASLTDTGREFYMPVTSETNENVTTYKSWSFDTDGSATIFRGEHEVHPPTKQCAFVNDGEKTIKQCSVGAPPPNGIRWPIDGASRIHGWTKMQDTNKQTANMVVYNNEYTPILDAYVYQKRLYVNGEATECRVSAHEWWHWTFDFEEIPHGQFKLTNDILINEYVIAEEKTTIFNSTWVIDVKLGNCHHSVHKKVLSTAHVLKTHNLMGAHFHDIAKQEEHECLAHCHAHEDCRQWSWTPNDKHCFLHDEHCTKETCTLGSHSMNSFHSRGLAYFDAWSHAHNTKVSWNYIRVEDIIDAPFTCPSVNITTIPPLWQDAFKADYEPLTFDTTTVCNSMATMWESLPGYNTYNCEGRQCTYTKNDLETCGSYMNYARPDVSFVPDCFQEKQHFLALDWTSYCRYERSFYDKIPFLGGRNIKTTTKTMESMCLTVRDNIDTFEDKCQQEIDIEWFNNCFERTADYEDFCHVECIEHIEGMLDDGGTTDRSICDIREEYLDISDIDFHEDCECTLDNMIITDFCIMQDAYHVRDKVKVPELSNSQCSRDCATTLQDAMNRTTWRNWCSDFSLNKIPGTCSKTVCECDQENIGVAGTRCELTCPSGIDDGQELACSGRNGRCFAVDDTEIVELYDEKQKIAGEYRSESFEAPTMPIWQTGPSPTADGRCQCALGSGFSCSIPCDQCNNGTFGRSMASQYGICDSFNGICRGLAPWMRYNVEKAGELQISYNSTSFESALGTAMWSFPERFIYESDTTLVQQTLSFLNDNDGIYIDSHLESSFDQQDNIKLLLQVFGELCWDSTKTTFDYLSNEENIQMKGVDISLGTTPLKQFNIPASGMCTDIDVTDSLTLCYSKGRMYAKDEGGTLIVVESDAPTRAEGAYISGMSFAVHPNGHVLAFGGEWDYGSTKTKLNTVYKIDVKRQHWTPADIVFLNWYEMPVTGTIPPNQNYAPASSFLDAMYILSTDNVLYKLELPTPMNSYGEWKRIEHPVMQSGARSIVGNNKGQIIIYLVAETWTYTPDATTQFIKSKDGPATTIPPFGSVLGTPVDGMSGECSLELVRTDDVTELKFGGLTVLVSPIITLSARIYIEEWNLIDVSTRSNIIERFRETVTFAGGPLKTVTGLTQFQLATSLDYVERVYMQQARWTMSALMLVKYNVQNQIWPGEPSGEERIKILEPATFVDTLEFKSIFDSLSLAYFETDLDTTPNYLNIFFESSGPSSTSLVIQGNYLERKVGYEQYFYIGTHKMVLYLEWDLSLLRVNLKKAASLNDGGKVEWIDSQGGIQSFVIVLPLEEWMRAVSLKKTDTFTSEYLPTVVGRTAMFSMFVSSLQMQTHSMMKQTANYLAYTSSHCSITAGQQCPGLLPYINLPCSGRGRCNIACQCVCEVAPSVLQTNPNALQNIAVENSPYRGRGCELTCPGFDGFKLTSICSGIGVCQYDGSCSCPQGYTGDSCQFKCPIDEEGNICSAHGGCGTKATESASFIFTGDNYMDIITATNKKNYAMALASFYNRGTCPVENYVIQPYSSFKNNVRFNNGDFNAPEDIKKVISECERINREIREDVDRYKDEEFREYPYDMCIGFEESNGKYLLATLLKPEWRPLNLLSGIKTTFECKAIECSFEPAETNDDSIRGLQTNLMTPSFEIKMTYVHGQSSGTEHYKVNDIDFMIKTEWTPRKFKIEMGYGSTWSTFEWSEFISIFKIRIEPNSRTIVSDYKLFRGYSPEDAEKTTYLAPLFENKYIPIRETLDRYTLIKNNAPFSNFEEVEYACDMLLECTGIVQWDDPFKENQFTLYSETDNVEDFEAHQTPTFICSDTGECQFRRVFLKKMSMVYQGAEDDNSKCDTIAK